MAHVVEASSPAFRVRANAVRKYSGTKVPLPDPVWTGTDTPLATCVVEADGTVLVTPKDTPGTFTLSVTSSTLTELPAGTLEVTLTEEGFDRIEVEVVPV